MKNQIVLILTIASGILQAQATVPAARPDTARAPSRGKVWISLHSSEPVTDFRQLVEMSDLIIEGTILLIYPTSRVDPSNPLSLETQARVGISDILKGGVPDSGRVVRVTQIGGELDELEVQPRGITMFQSGERYMLFLNSARYDAHPEGDGVPLYRITGALAGASLIDGDKVRFPEGADARLHADDGVDVEALKGKIRDIVENRLLPEHRMLLPIHPGPADRFPTP